MITKIEVDGFKSLSNFELELRPGLNILVGPNGAGKTNIILFFEFLSYIMKSELSGALSKAGGAGSILRKTGEENYQKKIRAKIYGGIDQKLSPREKNGKRIEYEYEFEIRLSEENRLYFEKQRFKILLEGKTILDLEQKTKEENENLKTTIKVKTIDKEMLTNLKGYYGLFWGPTVKDKKTDKLIKEIEDFLKKSDLESNSIITQSFQRESEYFRNIANDIKGGETFNIIPSEVKKPEDIARGPGIEKNGAGLAATLYYLKTTKPRKFNRRTRYNILRTPSFEDIIEYVKLANESIADINVVNDPFSNNLTVKITITEEAGEKAVLPLAQMSDGTIKWMALITAILTYRNIFSIEEPENFLHPWMQAEILNIMRTNTDEKSFILMTTHSESLLNAARPEEIIVVSMKEGKTYARRVENIDILNNEISKTGFGFGHFYFSVAIETRDNI